ncbi:MAG: DUF6364 family protein [Spirochaetales bacterium]
MERTKLTLSIDRHVIERAKQNAVEQHTTVSAMVEAFLREATKDKQTPAQEEPVTDVIDTELPSDLQALAGCLKDYADLDPDEVRYQYLKEKYHLGCVSKPPRGTFDE